MKMPPLSFDNIKSRAAGQWIGILCRLAPELSQALSAPGKHVSCPRHGGRDGFRVFDDVSETGGGICNTCGAFNDGFSLIRWLRGWSFPETLQAVAEIVGGDALPSSSRLPLQVATLCTAPELNTRAWDYCRKIWCESKPNAARIREYFEFRGIRLETLPHDLRLHNSLSYFQDGRLIGSFPAMLALLRDGTGKAVAIHRTFLDPNGPGKASIIDPKTAETLPSKKLTSPIRRGAAAEATVRLALPLDTLAIAEGIEAAAAVLAATGCPTWAAWSAVSFSRAAIPESIKAVELWPDADPVGQNAARQLGERLSAKGVAVRIFRAQPNIAEVAP